MPQKLYPHRLLLLFGLCAAATACAGLAGDNPLDVASAAEAATATATSGAPPTTARTATLTTAAPEPASTETAPAPSSTPTETPMPSATPCAEPSGVASSLRVPSPTLRYDIDARIYLPPCYNANQARYPVLYLIHGLSYTENQWERLGITAAADRLIAAGEIAPLIIVMPRDRLDDRLDTAFAADLVPFIDGHYRTLPDRLDRAIGGLSRGGGWSVHLGLHYPDLFGRIGAHSPAIFYGDENRLLEWTRAILKSGQVPAVYIDVGENDGQRRSAFWLTQVFGSVGIDHTYKLQPGSHTEKYWTSHVEDYLRFYAGDWLETPTPTATSTTVE